MGFFIPLFHFVWQKRVIQGTVSLGCCVSLLSNSSTSAQDENESQWRTQKNQVAKRATLCTWLSSLYAEAWYGPSFLSRCSYFWHNWTKENGVTTSLSTFNLAMSRFSTGYLVCLSKVSEGPISFNLSIPYSYYSALTLWYGHWP